MYNGSTYYYYNDGSEVAYYQPDFTSEEFYLDVKFKPSSDLDSKNYVLIQEIITDAPKSSIH